VDSLGKREAASVAYRKNKRNGIISCKRSKMRPPLMTTETKKDVQDDSPENSQGTFIQTDEIRQALKDMKRLADASNAAHKAAMSSEAEEQGSLGEGVKDEESEEVIKLPPFKECIENGRLLRITTSEVEEEADSHALAPTQEESKVDSAPEETNAQQEQEKEKEEIPMINT